MAKFTVRLAHAPRRPDFPEEDEALGAGLWAMLVAKLSNGVPRPALFTLFSESVQIVDVAPLLVKGVDVHRAFSAFASQAGAEALAAVGVMIRQHRGKVVGRFAVAFVEWPDGRWWSCSRPLDAAGLPMEGAEDDVQRAVDGAPKPGGLGAWFRRARFEGLTLKLEGEPVN